MSGVNIFGEPLQLNENLTPQRGPAGVGFRYLDAIGNFDHYDAIEILTIMMLLLLTIMMQLTKNIVTII